MFDAESWKEKREAVREIIRSDVWKHIVVPSLADRLRKLERHLATLQSITLDEVREAHGFHRCLTLLIENPEDFLVGDPH